jgi:hypothetical protein
VALADSPDGGIAAHLTNRFHVVREQQGPCIGSRGRKRSFGSGMTAANYYDVKDFGIFHNTGSLE